MHSTDWSDNQPRPAPLVALVLGLTLGLTSNGLASSRIVLSAPTTFSLTVTVVEDEQPDRGISGAHVNLTRLNSDYTPVERITDSRGRAVFEGLADRIEYEISVCARNRIPSEPYTFEIAPQTSPSLPDVRLERARIFSASGRIVDAIGAVIPAAKVTAFSQVCSFGELEEKAETLSNATGYYKVSVPVVPNPKVSVVAIAEGFEVGTKLLSANDVAASQSLENVDLTLVAGAFTETITVHSEPPLVNTNPSSGQRQIGELPLNRRNLSRLMLLAPGVAYARSSGSVSFHGVAYVGFTVDMPPSRTLTSESGVEPASVQISPGSGVTNLLSPPTGTGSNAFHGGVTYSVQHDAFAAHQFFNLPDYDIFRRHSGFGKIGGPLRKNKTFFFAAYSLARSAVAPSYAPNLQKSLGEFNSFLATLGLPAEDLGSVLPSSNNDQATLRLDFNPSDSHQIRMFYSFDKVAQSQQLYDTLPSSSTVPSGSSAYSLRGHTASLGHDWILSSSAINKIAYRLHRDSHGVLPAEPEQLSLLVPGRAVSGRTNNLIYGDEFRFTDHAIENSTSATYGDHSATLHVEFSTVGNLVRFPAFDSGRVVIDPMSINMASRHTAELFQLGAGRASTKYRTSVFRVQAKDDWRLHTDLTLSFGLGFKKELVSGTRAVRGTDLEPRIGLAWRPPWFNDTVTLRADYQLSRQRFPVLPLGLERVLGGGRAQGFESPDYLATAFVGSDVATDAFERFLETGSAPAGPPFSLAVDPRARSPYVQKASLVLQKRFLSDWTAEVGYITQKGTALLTAENLTTGVISEANPIFSQVVSFQTVGNSIYHALELRLQRRMSSGLSMNAEYAFSKTIDNLPTAVFERTPQFSGNRGHERAASDLHAAHKVSGVALWNVPRRFTGFGQLTLVGIGRFLSGRFYNVTLGRDLNRDGNPFTDRPVGLGRNTFRGQGFFQTDFRVSWAVNPIEDLTLKLYADVQNLQNRANFTAFNTVIGDQGLARLDPRVLSGSKGMPEFDFRAPLAPNGFGEAIRAATPRTVEVGIELSF